MNSTLFPAEPTHSWLAAVLRQNGLLDSARVASVEVSETGAFNSRTSRLSVVYSPDAPLTAPTHLILKRNTLEEWSKAAGADEVTFYRLAMERKEALPMVPPCFAAEYDPSSGDSYLLLQDLSETHKAPITRDDQISMMRGIPQIADQESVIDALARFHAYWWEHPLQDTGIFEMGFWSRDAERFASYLERRKRSWKTLLSKEAAWFPPALTRFYQQLFEALPGFWARELAPRFAARENLTLIHGDAYFANFLCPKTSGAGPTYLLDWQSPGWDLAGYDLVNLLATFWTREQRQEGGREWNLLRRYFNGLQAHGVQGVRWEDLLADYQAGLIFWALMPVQDGADGASKTYWWPKMMCLLDAFSDWQCMQRLAIPGMAA